MREGLRKRINLGKRGEDIAAAFLQDLGYCIIERNYRVRLGEIDIVADDHGTLVFVEVKTRSGDDFGSPAEAVTPAKQMQLSRVALEYMTHLAVVDVAARFDVVAILLKDEPVVEVFINAFDLCYGV